MTGGSRGPEAAKSRQHESRGGSRSGRQPGGGGGADGRGKQISSAVAIDDCHIFGQLQDTHTH